MNITDPLVLRNDVSGNPSFRELVGRVRETDLAAYGHQDVPFERLVEVLNPARSMSRHPLFQVMLAFQNNAEASMALPGLVVEPERTDLTVAKFDLSINLVERFTDSGEPEALSAIATGVGTLFIVAFALPARPSWLDPNLTGIVAAAIAYVAVMAFRRTPAYV